MVRNNSCNRKFIICIFMLCLGTTISKAQVNNNSPKRLPLDKAVDWVNRGINEKYRTKAAADIEFYANQGNTTAMNALGILYSQGLDKKKNLETAQYWFELASEKGCLKADYNLAMLYRRGIGVEQDFEKAYKYICKATITDNNPQALYGKGYFLYKGLGCTQDYKEAVKYFKVAATKDHGYAMYMLGLCYRNGYGIGLDEAQAQFWLTKAAAKNIKYSQYELNLEKPERYLQPTLLKSLAIQRDTSLAHYKKTKHEISRIENISGEYTGMLITYDWSGKYVIREEQVQVDIEQFADEITAYWQEGNEYTMKALGLLTDSTLLFTKASYTKADRRSQYEEPLEWKFIKADLNTVKEKSNISLNGSVYIYFPDKKEPAQPMYLTLQKKIGYSNENIDIKTSLVSVYPNPFKDYINISMDLNIEDNYNVNIYSITNGNLIYREKLGWLSKGTHYFRIDLNISEGRYIISVENEKSKLYSSVILKN